MTRNRRSARGAGTRFERQVADWFAKYVDDRIDRRVKTGNKDRGDIGGLRHMNGRVVIEVKDTARVNLATWAAEAEIERLNDDALVGIICHKRHGRGAAADQWITMTLADFTALLLGYRPEEMDPPA